MLVFAGVCLWSTHLGLNILLSTGSCVFGAAGYRKELKSVESLESLGLLLDGPTREIRNKPSRVWKLYHGTKSLAR